MPASLPDFPPLRQREAVDVAGVEATTTGRTNCAAKWVSRCRVITSRSPITSEMLANPPDGDWLMHYRTYSGWSNSPLNQITTKNVGLLQLKWAWPLEDGMRQQITPLVHDGVMFLTTNMSNTVQALDAPTGELLWEHRRDHRDGRSKRDADDGDVRQSVVLSSHRRHVIRAGCTTGNVVWKKKASSSPTTKSGKS